MPEVDKANRWPYMTGCGTGLTGAVALWRTWRSRWSPRPGPDVWCRPGRCRAHAAARRSAPASTIIATRSSLDRSAGQPVSQRGLGRGDEPPRHRRPLDVDPDRLQPDRVAAGRQAGQHPRHRHRSEQLSGGEQLVRPAGQLAGAVGGAHPRPNHRHPPAAERHLPGPHPVPRPDPVWVVLPVGPPSAIIDSAIITCITCRPGTDSERQQPLLRRLDDLGHGDRRRLRHDIGRCARGRACAGRSSSRRAPSLRCSWSITRDLPDCGTQVATTSLSRRVRR